MTTTRERPADYAARHTITADTVFELPLEAIAPSPLNPRIHFGEAELEELAASIREHGLLQPIVVRPREAGLSDGYGPETRYWIVAGERRWRASAIAEETHIAAIVREDLDAAAHLKLALIENLHREDLDAIEEANGYKRLQDEAGMTQAEVAAAVNRGQPAINKAIALLELPADVQDLISRRTLSVSHGHALGKYRAFPAAVSFLATSAVEQRWAARVLETGIPDLYALQQHGLATRIASWEIDPTPCESCPFGARFGEVCLKPEHYRELQRAKAQEAQKAIQRAVSAAKASGEQLIKLKDLKWDTYKELTYGTPPLGCTDACDCRAEALDRDGLKLVPICTDPARYGRLQSAETKAKTKDKRETGRRLAERVTERLDLVGGAGGRELAVLAAAAARSVGQQPAIKRDALATYAAELIPEEARKGWEIRDRFPELEALQPVDLVKLAVAIVLHAEIRERYESGYGSTTPLTDWYLDGTIPKSYIGSGS